MVIRSSSLVNEATGVKFLKDGMESDGSKKRSSQGDKIAAAAAAVGGRGRNRGRKGGQGQGQGEGQNPRQNQGSGDQNPPKQNRNEPRSGAPRNQGRGGQPRHPQGQGQPRRDQQKPRPKDPALKDRLDYYKSKYGEEFKPVQENKPKKSGGIIGAIAGLFGLGKKKK